MEKISNKDQGTQDAYKTALNNLENFCMEKYGNIDYISKVKKFDTDSLFDFIQSWINWNNQRSPSTTINMFSRIKKYLYHRGIKLHPQDIKEELEFRSRIEEELYPLSVDNIQSIVSNMRYKHKTQFICQSSSLMRIGEIVQLRKKHLILEGQNIIIKIPATIAKFKKGRTTFFSKEASKLLRPMLRNLDDDDLIFGTNDNVKHSEINSEQILRRILEKSGLNMRYESNNRYMINTHSFRAFGITKISRHDPNFAKKIAGQKGYLLQYDRMDDDEKLELYEKYENDLIIDTIEKQKIEIQRLESEKSEIHDLKSEMKEIRDLLIKQGNPDRNIGYYDLVDSETYKAKKELVKKYAKREIQDD